MFSSNLPEYRYTPVDKKALLGTMAREESYLSKIYLRKLNIAQNMKIARSACRDQDIYSHTLLAGPPAKGSPGLFKALPPFRARYLPI
ncbi:hypothetical protein QWA_03050 [Alcaligenes faecalis subsp. faecalis NCIB 8687]|nr:hypothetical protein QWA_03050 [Alcaligenes faecalis subsp. faecalis NCIB 8687]